MHTTLETADRIAKIILAVGVIIAFLAEVISGPFALPLLIISLIVILIEGGKIFFTLINRD